MRYNLFLLSVVRDVVCNITEILGKIGIFKESGILYFETLKIRKRCISQFSGSLSALYENSGSNPLRYKNIFNFSRNM